MCLKNKCMKAPSPDDWKKIADDFDLFWQFPNCIGALDGKHVMYKKPPKSGTLYYNYNGLFSIILMALVDAHYRFIMIDVEAYGHNFDGIIFTYCEFGKAFLSDYLGVPYGQQLPGSFTAVPYTIVADKAFALHPNVMRPFPG